VVELPAVDKMDLKTDGFATPQTLAYRVPETTLGTKSIAAPESQIDGIDRRTGIPADGDGFLSSRVSARRYQVQTRAALRTPTVVVIAPPQDAF
jgi:hypothetical protein